MGSKRGIAYGVGTGPGDPELMTLKACRLIRENEVIALPGKDPRRSAAYRIAVRAVPELADKELLAMEIPMVKNGCVLKESRAKAAAAVEEILDSGRNVVYLALGDPCIYSSFSYIKQILDADGYETETVSGVTSFCAAAARLGTSLAEWDEPLHVIPSLHTADSEAFRLPGNTVFMKSGGKMQEIRTQLAASGREALAIENCGMDGEKIYRSADEMPDEAGYFMLVIAR